MANCDCCRRILFHGFRCTTCGIRFHSACASQVPTLCQPALVENYYRRNYSKDEPSSGLKRSSSVSSNSRERSSSEPNILSNMIVQTNLANEENGEETEPTTGQQQQQREPRARSADESLKKIQNFAHEHESMKDWEILENEIAIKECIGSGSYGTVFRGHWHGPVALKKLKVANPTQDQLLVQITVVWILVLFLT